MQERKEYFFTIDERPNGSLIIDAEPYKENISVIEQGVLTFVLARGIEIEDARKLAELMNKDIAYVEYTE